MKVTELKHYKLQNACVNCKHSFADFGDVLCNLYEPMPWHKIPSIDCLNLEDYCRWADRNRVVCNGICDKYESVVD